MSRSWLSHKDFEALVARAVKDLPKDFRRYLDNVAIEVQEEPNMEALEAVGLEPEDADELLGLYWGRSIQGSSFFDTGGQLPDRISSIAARSCVCVRRKKRSSTRGGKPWSTRSATTSGL